MCFRSDGCLFGHLPEKVRWKCSFTSALLFLQYETEDTLRRISQFFRGCAAIPSNKMSLFGGLLLDRSNACCSTRMGVVPFKEKLPFGGDGPFEAVDWIDPKPGVE